MIDLEMAGQLLAEARLAAGQAYAPYSQFSVGSALLTADGTVVTGANVENLSYGLTCCAERTALFTAAAAGHRVVTAIAVTAPQLPGVTPCGACRQVLNEFAPPDGDLIVILDLPDGPELLPLGELLPRAFRALRPS